jgi:hypothetical protein
MYRRGRFALVPEWASPLPSENDNKRGFFTIFPPLTAISILGYELACFRNGCNVCSWNSFGSGSNSPASLERAAQSTRAWYWLNSVIPPSQSVPLSFEMVTTFGRSHGPKQPLIVSWTRFKRPLARHSLFSQSTGTGGRPFSVFPQQHPWQIVRCPMTIRLVVSGNSSMCSMLLRP